MRKIVENKRRLYIYLAMFFTAFSLFMFEVLLTRLFSAILSYTMVFLVVSFAILGGGIGGIIAYSISKKHKGKTSKDLLPKFSLWLPISIGLSISTMYYLPYIPIFLFYVLAGAVPFMIGGILISLMFKDNADGSSKLYFMDLAGSALGSLAVIQLMNKFGFMSSVIMVCILSSLAVILINCFYNKNKRAVILVMFTIALTGLFVQGSFIKGIEKNFNSFYTNPDKILSYLEGTDEKPLGISFTKWDSISRTDVIETTSRDEKIVTTDGGGSAPIVRFDGDLKTVEYLKKDVKYIPFTFGNNDSTLIIGSGGGKDVLFALLGGSKRIDAVEINPSTIEAVNKFKDFSGDIYNRPGVKLYIQDGRNFINNSKDKYDNIFLSMVMTNSVENNMYSLSENYIYTYEAFEKYLDHLNDNGKLSFMTHNAYDTVKIVNTGVKVLLDRGIAQEKVTDYFVIVNGMDAEHNGAHGNQLSMPLIMFKNKPFTKEEIDEIKFAAKNQNKDMVHYSGEEVDIYKSLKDGDLSYDKLIALLSFNAKPTRDNSPFFYNYSKFVPIEILYILIGVLIIWLFIRKRFLSRKEYRTASIYFAGLGVAYMLVEIPIIQRMVLYFGNSSLTFSVILFSILISSGIGSALSGLKLIKKFTSASPIYLLTTALSIIVVQLSLGNIMAITNNFRLVFKTIVGFITILPMGLLMGIPFPTGINKLEDTWKDESVIPLMWGTNGIFSIVGSVLAVIISMKLGFDITIYAGAAVYLLLYLVNPLKIGVVLKPE